MAQEQLRWERIDNFQAGYITRDPSWNLPPNALAGGSQNFRILPNEARVRPGAAAVGSDQGAATVTGIHRIDRTLTDSTNTIIVTWSDGDVDVITNIDSSPTFLNKGAAVMADALVSFAELDDFTIYADGTNVRRMAGVTVAALTDAALGGSPPAYPFVATWRNSVWLFDDGSPTLRYSDAEDPETWPAAKVINVDKGGPPGTGLHALSDRLVCFKREQIHHIVGYDTLSFERIPVSNSVGCVSNESIVEVTNSPNPRWNGLYWAGADGYYFSPDAGFTNEKISRLIPNFAVTPPQASDPRICFGSKTVAVQRRDTNEVVCFIPSSAGGANDQAIAWNYELGAWSSLLTNQNYRAVGEVWDGDIYRILAGREDNPGVVHDLSVPNAGITDAGTAITGILRTPFFSFGTPEQKFTLRKILITHANDDAAGATWSYDIYTDHKTATATVSSTFTQAGYVDEVWVNRSMKAVQIALTSPTSTATISPDVASIWIGYTLGVED